MTATERPRRALSSVASVPGRHPLFTRLPARLFDTVDGGGLALFRVAFGAVMALAVVRFVARGWVERLFVEPSFHFKFLGFEWVSVWSRAGLYAHYVAMGGCALLLSVGYRTRWAAAAFCALFTYAELLEKSAYLNHYYLVSLLSFLLVLVPSEARWSLDARRLGLAPALPRWAYWVLRAQVGCVYVYAGLAKLNADWLLRGEPLHSWLLTYGDLPLLDARWFAVLASWAGALFDLAVVPALCWRKTRPFAFAAAVAFHGVLAALFPIGVFPWLMVLSVTVFFEPTWPLRAAARARGWLRTRALSGLQVPPIPPAPSSASATRFDAARWSTRAVLALCAFHLVLQVLVPWRFLLYPGSVNWSEQGFRFAWRVMLVEKTGQVELRVVLPARGARLTVYPKRELTPFQYRMMSTQPDMIHEYALHVAERFRAQGNPDVEVYADAWVAFNQRPSQRLLDPSCDLAREARSLAPLRCISPLE